MLLLRLCFLISLIPSSLGFAPLSLSVRHFRSSNIIRRLIGISADHDNFDGRKSDSASSNHADTNTQKMMSTSKTTSKDINFIRHALERNVLFESLSDSGFESIIQGFEKIQVRQGQVIIRQGDSSYNDYVYLVADGTICTVKIDGVLVPEPYGTLTKGALVGELGVLYDKDRAATITVRESSTSTSTTTSTTTTTTPLFRIRGNVFKDILLFNQGGGRGLLLGSSREEDSEISLDTMQQVDWAINKVEGTILNYGGNVIPIYQPERLWLWQQFEGTILPISIPTTLTNVAFSLLFCLYAKIQIIQTTVGDGSGWDITNKDWSALLMAATQHQPQQLVPDKSLLFVERLGVVHQVWQYQKGLTTFVLTFFLNVAFGIWKDSYNVARDLQGRLDDFNLLLATNVGRDPRDGSLTPEAEQVLADVGQYSRLYHILVWASLTKRFSVLATPYGLERMCSRGLITGKQCDILQEMDVPANNLHHIPLEWMMIRVNSAMKNGTIPFDNATKGQFLTQTIKLRNDHSTLQGKLAGRIPLAYVHIVQILVDSLIVISPLALYAELGDYSVIAVAILTLFYTGLLNLAKIFLDPLNDEKYCDNTIYMDLGVLMRESNTGSVGWKNAGTKLPFP